MATSESCQLGLTNETIIEARRLIQSIQTDLAENNETLHLTIVTVLSDVTESLSKNRR